MLKSEVTVAPNVSQIVDTLLDPFNSSKEWPFLMARAKMVQALRNAVLFAVVSQSCHLVPIQRCCNRFDGRSVEGLVTRLQYWFLSIFLSLLCIWAGISTVRLCRPIDGYVPSSFRACN